MLHRQPTAAAQCFEWRTRASRSVAACHSQGSAVDATGRLLVMTRAFVFRGEVALTGLRAFANDHGVGIGSINSKAIETDRVGSTQAGWGA